MTPTSVGMRCPECARERTQVRRLATPGLGIATAGWSATNVLIAINVVVFLAELATGVTLGGSDSGWVFEHGALFGPLINGFGVHQYWRLLSSGFLHAGLIHIALNMLSLWFVGRVLEPGIGRANFLAVYFASLLAGSFGALLFTPRAPTIGASTAIFGIFGALIVVAYRRGIPLWQSGLGPMLALNLIFTLTIADISVGGHLGGLAAGVLCGFAVTDVAERRHRPQLAFALVALVAALSVVGAILVAGGTGLAPNGVHL
ncbi:MAG TPA: rhomboid family intramembrane serine protease [Solirubrobacteraceae bacterium]|nr:rhomboid family intramembrane serine protease [Solirubrobacteraceae bacterium]